LTPPENYAENGAIYHNFLFKHKSTFFIITYTFPKSNSFFAFFENFLFLQTTHGFSCSFWQN